jgi:hypothetical protein
MARSFLFVLAAAALLAPPSDGQMRGAVSRGGPRFAPAHRSFSDGHRGHRSTYPAGYYVDGLPYLYDDYSGDAPQPQAASEVVVKESTVAEPPARKASPLLIELQGERYVRFGGVAESNAGRSDRIVLASIVVDSKTATSGLTTRAHSAATVPPRENSPSPLQPTVLIYRDGHRQEIPNYAIVGATLYAHSNMWQTGRAMESIQLSALDIPATMKANSDQGVPFVLPSAPNEVVTRP